MGKANNQSIKTTKFFLPFSKAGPLAEKLSWLIALILVLLPFHALFTTWVGSSTGHLDLFRIWKEILLALSAPLVILLVYKSKDIQKRLKTSWISRLFLLYLALHLIIGAWALSQHQVTATALIYALIINLRFVFFFILCFIVSLHSGFLKANWRKILLIPACVVIGFGLIQKLLPLDFLRHFGYGPHTIPAYQTVDSDIDYRRIQSTLRGANSLGAYLVLTVAALITIMRKSRSILAVGTISGLVVLFYTYSRSAELGLIVSLILLAWLSRPKFNWRQPVILGAVILIIVAGGFYFLGSSQNAQDTLFHTSNTSVSKQSSNEARLNAMEQGVKDIWHQPLGHGPGTAGPASFRNDQPPRVAENYFLQIGQEVGLIGMAIFVAINALLAKQLWRRRQDQLPRILLASFIGLTFINLLSHAWTDDTLSYLWWGLAGVAIATPAIVSIKK